MEVNNLKSSPHFNELYELSIDINSNDNPETELKRSSKKSKFQSSIDSFKEQSKYLKKNDSKSIKKEQAKATRELAKSMIKEQSKSAKELAKAVKRERLKVFRRERIKAARRMAAQTAKKERHECHICGEVCVGNSFMLHVLSHAEPNVFLCKECGRHFGNADLLRRHAKTHTKPFVCQYCSMTFDLESNYDKHLNRHKRKKGHVCDICEKAFGAKSHLERHYRIHTNEKPYVCQVCFRGFNQSANYYKHCRTVHTNKHSEPVVNDNPDNICHLCFKTFTVRKSLTQHMMIHTGEKPYKCEICEQSFRRKQNLKNHTMLHLEVKSFQCSECGKSFINKWRLHHHMKYHTGIKPHRCHVCGKEYFYESHLNNHFVTHTQQKHHICVICHRAFAHYSALARHLLVHKKKEMTAKNACNTTANNIRDDIMSYVACETTMEDQSHKLKKEGCDCIMCYDLEKTVMNENNTLVSNDQCTLESDDLNSSVVADQHILTDYDEDIDDIETLYKMVNKHSLKNVSQSKATVPRDKTITFKNAAIISGVKTGIIILKNVANLPSEITVSSENVFSESTARVPCENTSNIVSENTYQYCL